jgi:hypothetical protein
MNMVQFTLILLIRLYQVLVSPLLVAVLGPSARCRFTPSCSQYAREAVRLHGALKGGWLALRRLVRCHPWGGCGDDPPPAHSIKWKLPNWNILGASRFLSIPGIAHVAQPSSAAGSRPVPVREPETGGETPPQPAGEDACATSIGIAVLKTEILPNLRKSSIYHGS